MEIMTTWNTNFEFDLQRFAAWSDGTVAGSSTSKLLLAELPTNTATAAQTNLWYDADGNAFHAADTASGVKIGTIELNADGAYVVTLTVEDYTDISVAQAATKYAVKSTQKDLTFSSADGSTNTFTLAKGKQATVYGATAAQTVNVSAVDSEGLTVTKGDVSVVPGTTGITVYDTNSDAAYSIKGSTAAAAATLTKGKGISAATAGVDITTTVALPVGGASSTLLGTATLGTTADTFTLGIGSTLAGNTKLVTTSGSGTYTLNGVKFTTTDDATAITVTADKASPTQLTLDNFAATDSFVIDEMTSAGIAIVNGTAQFNAVSTGVSFTGGTNALTATLNAFGQTVTHVASSTAVTMNNGAATITNAGRLVIESPSAGNSIQVGTQTWTFNKSKDGRLTVTDGAAVYTFKNQTTPVLDVDLTASTGLAYEATVTGGGELELYKPLPVVVAVSNGGTAELSSALEDTGTLIIADKTSGDYTTYATETRTNASTYTLTFESAASALTEGITIDSSKLPASATLTVTPAKSPDTTYYKTTSGKIQVANNAGGTFTITGDIVNTAGTTATNDPFSVVEGTIVLANTTPTDVKTNIGTFTVTDAAATATKISSEGVFSGIDTNGIVALNANKEAEENATTNFTVGGKSFTALSTEGATIKYDGQVYRVTGGKVLVNAGTAYLDNGSGTAGASTMTIKVTGGDGVFVDKNGIVSGLNEGETATITFEGATGAQVEKYVYSVNSGILKVSTYTVGTATPADLFYTLTGDSISMNNATVPVTGEYEAMTDTFTSTLGLTTAGVASEAVADGKTLYIQKDRTTTYANDSSKTVGSLAISNDVATYEASSGSKGQTITINNGNEKNYNWAITGSSNADDITYSAASDATINAGAGKDTITANGTGNVVLNAGDGKNEIYLNGTGEYTVTMGSGNNVVDHSTGTNGNATITGGSGNDTITAAGAEDVVSGGDGKDVFYVGKGIKVNDYNFDNDVIYTNGSAFTVTDEGKVSTASGAADISATAGDFYAAQIKTGTGKAANWAWAKDGGSTIDITSFTKDAYLQGDADGASALYAGSGDDVITAKSDNDSVFGGAGKNTINLGSGEKRVVGMSSAARAKDTVSGFKASFEDEGDSIFMVDGSIASVVVDTVSGSAADLTIKSDGSSVSLKGAGVSTVTGAVELKIAGAKAAVIASGATATVESADYADAYVGKNSAVNFSKVDGDLYVDLSNGLTASGNGAKFVGITAVTGGTGVNTLMGSAKADYIVAGTGKSSLYGGAGADTLVGNGEADMFFIGEGTNTNTITKFMASGSENSDTVKILGDVTNAKLNGSTIVLGTADGSKAVIQNLSTGSINANTMVNVEANNFTGVAKLGESGKANNFTYDKSVGYYGGGSQVDKVSVASGFSDNAEVWLDGSKGTAFGSVDQVDFRNGTGNYILAGDSSKNTIVGGKGDSSLWGGAGSSADSVVGTAGGTTKFFYGIGEGNDTLVAGSSNDNVNLYNIKVSDLTGYEITGSGVKLTTTTGDNVFVNTGNKNISFTLSDGSTYTANQSTKSWE